MEEMKNTDGQGQAQTDTPGGVFVIQVRQALGLSSDASDEKVLRTCRLYAEEHACVMALMANVLEDTFGEPLREDREAVERMSDAVNPYEEG